MEKKEDGIRTLFTGRGSVFLDMAAIVVIFLCIAVLYAFYGTKKIYYNDEYVNLSDGWTAKDGQEYSISDLPQGDIMIIKNIEDVDPDGKRLCFKSIDTHLTVCFDGKPAYTYAPEYPSILGDSYGMYIHMIFIPEGTRSVTFTLHPVYYGTSANIENIGIADAGMYMGDFYHNALPAFILSLLIVIFGVLMLIMGFTDAGSGSGKTVDFFSLASLAIIAGIWSVNDTCVVQVYTQHPEIMHFTTYLCLMFICYPPVSFVASATRQRKTVLLPLVFGLAAVNFVTAMVLSVLGIADVRQMLTFSHVNIGIAMASCIYLIVKAFKKKSVGMVFLHMILIGISSLVVFTFIDIIRFKVNPESSLGAGFFSRFGVMIFIFLIGIHLIRERTRIAVENGQTELMKKLAFTDGLTQIANRAAFELKEEEIRKGHGKCFIVQLDINFLKKVNDEYGHAEGDRHIINTARIITESFENIGTCFRTGGDEFIVVTGNCSESDVNKALDKLEKLVSDYNKTEEPPVPLMIACGYAGCDPSKTDPEEAEKIADQRMYENKRRMKEASGL